MDIAGTIALSLGSAILGSVAGFFGAVHIERQRLQRTRVGMLRALVSELIENAHAVQKILLTESTNLEMSSETWKQVRGELAEIMPVELYENVNALSMSAPVIKRYPGEIGQEQADVLVQFLLRTRSVLQGLIQLPAARGIETSTTVAFEGLQEVGKALRYPKKEASGQETPPTSDLQQAAP
jgi:hypothetical protein